MYFIYVDESGDPGRKDTSSAVLVLAGLTVAAARQPDVVKAIEAMRGEVQARYGLKPSAKMRGSDWMREGSVPVGRRVEMIEFALKKIAAIPGLRLFLVAVNKDGLPAEIDIYRAGWKAMLQRFDGWLARANRGAQLPKAAPGVVMCDDTRGGQLNALVSELKARNPVEQRGGLLGGARTVNRPLRYIIEDPLRRNGRESQLIQAADLCAYAVYQAFSPRGAPRDGKKPEDLHKALAPVTERANGPFGVHMVGRVPKGMTRQRRGLFG
ncbi:MAG: DUF3800 domain-containing protein [Maricaulaceae bacterium]|nr:DUF3800 domain-containing protein [Maricaulaceae bacterium]